MKGALAAVTMLRASRAADFLTPGFQIFGCDWTLRKKSNPEAFELASRIGLDGMRVDFPALRRALDAIGYRGWVGIEGVKLPLGVEKSIRYDLEYLRPIFPKEI